MQFQACSRHFFIVEFNSFPAIQASRGVEEPAGPSPPGGVGEGILSTLVQYSASTLSEAQGTGGFV